MSILIYAEYAEGKFKKVAFELASYAKKVAETLGTTVTAVTINAGDVSELSKYGVDKVLKVNNDKLSGFTAKAYADVIKQAAEKENVKLVLLSSTTDSIYLSSLVHRHRRQAPTAPDRALLPCRLQPQLQYRRHRAWPGDRQACAAASPRAPGDQQRIGPWQYVYLPFPASTDDPIKGN